MRLVRLISTKTKEYFWAATYAFGLWHIFQLYVNLWPPALYIYTTQAINLTGKMKALIKLFNFILTTKSPGVKFSGSTNPITGKKYV